MEPCIHETLAFGSGGYYIFCHACGAVWDPSGSHSVDTGVACIPRTAPNGDSCLREGNLDKCMTNVCQHHQGGVRKS